MRRVLTIADRALAFAAQPGVDRTSALVFAISGTERSSAGGPAPHAAAVCHFLLSHGADPAIADRVKRACVALVETCAR